MNCLLNFNLVLLTLLIPSLGGVFPGLEAYSNTGFSAWCTKYQGSDSAAGSSIIKIMRKLHTRSCKDLEIHIRKNTSLWLDGINLEDISFLRFFDHLERLDLTDNHIRDIRTLEDLTRLSHLWLGENNISDISPLQKLRNLMLVVLEDNHIKDASPLTHCSELMAVDLSRNQLTNTGFVAGLRNLRYIFLNHNQIRSVKSISSSGEDMLLGLKVKSTVHSFAETDWDQLILPAFSSAHAFRIFKLDRNPVAREFWEPGAVFKTPENCPTMTLNSEIKKLCLGLKQSSSS